MKEFQATKRKPANKQPPTKKPAADESYIDDNNIDINKPTGQVESAINTDNIVLLKSGGHPTDNRDSGPAESGDEPTDLDNTILAEHGKATGTAVLYSPQS